MKVTYVVQWDVSKTYYENDRVYFHGQLYEMKKCMINGKYIMAFVPIKDMP